jgi:aminopeptidase YwaD
MGLRFRIATLLVLFSFAFFLQGDGSERIMEEIVLIENLKRHVAALHFDRSPFGYSGLERAGRYIQEEMKTLGFDVKEDILEWEGKIYRNIISEKKGTVFPERVILVGAHYDTVPGSPGADDNGSAIAVLLEVARGFQNVSLESTLKLVAFTLEEVGFVGSIHYARRAEKEGEKVVGMISLEMVGFTHGTQNYPPYLNPKYYPNVGDFISIIGNERSRPFLEEVVRSFKKHTSHLPIEVLLVPGNGEGMEEARLSDNSSFWDRGFPAVMITDTAFLRNPNYHLPSDTMETLDFEFMRKVALGVYFSVADLGKKSGHRHF